MVYRHHSQNYPIHQERLRQTTPFTGARPAATSGSTSVNDLRWQAQIVRPSPRLDSPIPKGRHTEAIYPDETRASVLRQDAVFDAPLDSDEELSYSPAIVGSIEEASLQGNASEHSQFMSRTVQTAFQAPQSQHTAFLVQCPFCHSIFRNRLVEGSSNCPVCVAVSNSRSSSSAGGREIHLENKVPMRLSRSGFTNPAFVPGGMGRITLQERASTRRFLRSRLGQFILLVMLLTISFIAAFSFLK
jgi:hypothetical protein